MAVEYDISSDVAVITETGSVSQCARVTQMYSGQITYDDEAGSKFATATINGKSQRVMLCIAVNGTVTYDDVPSLYSTVERHRCLNIVTPTETGTPDDVPSLYETVVIDGQNVRAVRCIMINKTPIYDGVSSTCTFTGDDGKTHTAQLVNKITGGSVVVIIKGTSPLNLPDAIANSLSYVKAFGGTEQRSVPAGYTQLAYIGSAGTQYIDLGYKGNGNTKVDVKFKYHTVSSSTGSGRVFGSRTSSTSNAFAVGTSSGIVAETANALFWCYDNQPYFASGENFGLNVWKTIVFSAKEHSIDGVSVGNDYEVVEFETPQNLKLFGFDTNGSMGVGYVDVAYCKLWDNGVLVRDLLPARRNSDNVLGMYDRVSGAFLTNDGTGTFAAGPEAVPTPDVPMDIVSNNGALKFGVLSTNLLDLANCTDGYYYTPAGAYTSAENARLSNYIPVKAGVAYTVGLAGVQGSSNVRLNLFDTAKNWLSQTMFVAYANTEHAQTITPAQDGFFAFSANYTSNSYVDWNTAQVVQGSYTVETMPEYEPYREGVYADGTVETIEDSLNNTATTEMLLKVGDYQDVQSILDGVITRNVGIKVLDGTEDWSRTNVRTLLELPDSAIGSRDWAPYCTHYQGFLGSVSISSMPDNSCKININTNQLLIKDETHNTDITTWKQWLAAQYAAGTPVIVVYPLATPTTESVAGQTLQVTDGDNVLEITQASLDGLELEAKYKAAVSLTIQEVQDANLDNNVEVTIS